MTKNSYKIEKLSRKEMNIPFEWAAKEGWNPGLYDAECFYNADPNGFFVGILDDEIIAIASAVTYEDTFAFFGLYIVKPEYRHQGYGLALTNARLNYAGKRLTGLDGVMNMLAKYENIGFEIANYNQRYSTNKIFDKPIDKNIIDLKQFPFETLLEYDQKYFPAKRPQFLKCWIQQPESFALGFIQDDRLAGYGVIRKCIEGHKIGPLFADSPEIADQLFQALAAKVSPSVYYLDIPETNHHAQMLIDKHNMMKTFRTARMYRNGQPTLNLAKIYGITTLELG